MVPRKLLPEIATFVPTGPPDGKNDDTTGGLPVVVTVKLVELNPVPSGVETEIGPVVAPLGTVALMLVSELTVKLVAALVLKATPVAPVKPVPVMETFVPTGPLVGTNDVITGRLALPEQLGNLNAPMRVCQLKVPLFGRYSPRYQNVQSSAGSMDMLV